MYLSAMLFFRYARLYFIVIMLLMGFCVRWICLRSFFFFLRKVSCAGFESLCVMKGRAEKKEDGSWVHRYSQFALLGD